MKKILYWFLLIIFIIACNSPKKDLYGEKKNDDTDKIMRLIKNLNKISASHGNKFFYIKLGYDSNNCHAIELTQTMLDSIPQELDKFNHLKFLTLGECNLTTLNNMYNSQIFCLDLIGNKFSSMPNPYSFPKTLGILHLQNNAFSGILTIDSLPIRLFWLDLSYNKKITNIVFKHPKNDSLISDLILDADNISELDSSVYLLPRLTNLSVWKNPIKNIDIKKFKSLKVLTVDKNYLFPQNDNTYIKTNNIYINYQ